MNRIEAVNDFVIKFANVNGSGSASANELFAKAILRMGVPVSPRNIFPSNIQGLPTWYEVRVSERGWLGRRGGIDMMVAMNPQTWDQDVREVESGGYLFYDSTRPLPPSAFRDDLNVIGMPVTAICNAAYQEPRQRQLFKNIVYVGALSVLLGIDAAEIEKLFAEQYRGKEKLLDSNVRALQLGRNFAQEHLDADKVGIKVERSNQVGDRIFVDGNTAAGMGCVWGGATVSGWYPITPSTSVPEAFEKYCSKLRIDPETGKETPNPNGVRRVRRVSWVYAYAARGELNRSQVAAAEKLRMASEGMRERDPLAAIGEIKAKSGDRAAAMVDARRWFHELWASIPTSSRPVIERVVIDDLPIWAGCGSAAWARHMSRLVAGLDAIP